MTVRSELAQVYYYNKQARRTEVRGCWCHSCWNEAKEGLVQLDGSTVPKKDLDKRKNDEEVRSDFFLYERDCKGVDRISCCVNRRADRRLADVCVKA